MKEKTLFHRILSRSLGGLLILTAASAAAQAPEGVLPFITAEDLSRQETVAREKGLTEVGRSMILELKDGPLIQVVEPGGGEIGKQPVEIDVVFEAAEDGAAPDMATLKVRYIKFFAIDITDRVKPYVSANRIHVTRAEFPKGTHTVELYVEDTRGKASSRVVVFKII